MKKISLLLALMLCLTACGSSEDPKKPINENGSDPVVNEPVKNDEVSINETVLFNQDGIIIKAVDLGSDTFYDLSVKLLIENNSDKDINITTANSSVNDYMMESYLSADVAAGKKANESMGFFGTDLDLANITVAKNIDFDFHIYEKNTYETLYDVKDLSLITTGSESYNQTFDESGFVAYESNGIKIVVKQLEADSLFGQELVCYISNESGNNILVSAENTSVNGFMIDGSLYSTVYNGKKSIDSIYFMDSEIESNGIESFENIELKFNVINPETYETILTTDVISIEF